METKKKKTGGRVAGTPNKTTVINRNLITSMLAAYSESGEMGRDFNSLDPKDRLQIAEKMMQYVMPKIQAVAVDIAGGGKKITIEDRLLELSKEE